MFLLIKCGLNLLKLITHIQMHIYTTFLPRIVQFHHDIPKLVQIEKYISKLCK